MKKKTIHLLHHLGLIFFTFFSYNGPNLVKISLICVKKISGLVLRVGLSKKLDPTLNTSPEPHLQQVLLCRHPCHNWDLGLGTPCEVVSHNFHALNG